MSTPWTADIFKADDDEEPGISLMDFANAMQVWEGMQQGRPVSVSEAAATFNVSPDLVRQAVEHHYWMFLNPPDEADPQQQFLEQDGE